MDRIGSAPRHLPERLQPFWAKSLAGLALCVLVLAALGFLYEGWQRVAYVTAFVSMGLANLAWAVGSLVPEGRWSTALRAAVSPLAVAMLLSLGAALAFLVGCG
jgi:hypothetical protein